MKNNNETQGMRERLLEKMASMEHERWSKWQRYMHSKILPTEHDALMQIGSEWIERWNRQIDTPYESLSEKEKESDREQVYPYLELFQSEIASLLTKAKQETERITREKIRKMIWKIDERIDCGDSWSHGIRDDILNDLSDNNKS